MAESKSKILVDGVDDVTMKNGEAPKMPPVVAERKVPEWFEPVYRWMKGVVYDEGVLLDLCMDKAIEIAEFNHNRGLVGIDHFVENSIPPRTQMMMFGVPLAVELYRQALKSIENNKVEFEALVKEALKNKRG